jgi:hypothetical protein
LSIIGKGQLKERAKFLNKASLMATWEDLDKDLNSDEDIEEAHLALMAQASSDE